MFKRENAIVSVPYEERIYSRSFLRYTVGLYPRLKQYIKHSINRFVARKNGATIGKNSVISWKLAKRANENLIIGNSVIVEHTAFLDLRGKIIVGNNAIIGNNVTILRGSHNIDDPYFATTFNNLIIEDYVWLSTGSVVLPRVSFIGEGTVLGAFSVLAAQEVAPMQIMVGNPAKAVKTRQHVHDKLVVESMKGGDYLLYVKSRKWFRVSTNKKLRQL